MELRDSNYPEATRQPFKEFLSSHIILISIFSFVLIISIGGLIAYFSLDLQISNFECDIDGPFECSEAGIINASNLEIESNYLLLEKLGNGTISSAQISQNSLTSEECSSATIDENSLSESGGKSIKIFFNCNENITEIKGNFVIEYTIENGENFTSSINFSINLDKTLKRVATNPLEEIGEAISRIPEIFYPSDNPKNSGGGGGGGGDGSSSGSNTAGGDTSNQNRNISSEEESNQTNNINSTINVGPSNPTGLWYTIYYPTWAMQALGSSYQGNELGIPPKEFDWIGVTHAVHFGDGNIVTTSPYWSPTVYPDGTGAGQGRSWVYGGCTGINCINYQQELITEAHTHGAKVVISIQAVNPTNLNAVIANPSEAQVLADAIHNYIISKGYDGVELNIETWTGTPVVWNDVYRFMTMVRTNLNKMNPRGLFLISPGEFHFNRYNASFDNLIDQYNLQTYPMGSPWNGCISSNSIWFMNALYPGNNNPPGSYYYGTGAQCFEGRAIDGTGSVANRPFGVDGWIAAGHDPKKIGIGIPAFGVVYKNNSQLYESMLSGSGKDCSQREAVRVLLNNGGTLHWDDVRKVNYINGTALSTIGNQWWGACGVAAGQEFFSTFESPASVQYKVDWAVQKGIGGIMIYSVPNDLDSDQPFGSRNPVHKALGLAIEGQQDGTSPIISVTVSPLSPSSSQQVTFTATATDSSGIASIKIYVDGVQIGTTCSSSPCQKIGGPYSTGSHNYHAIVVDSSSNANSATTSTQSFVSVAPDTINPAVSITSHTNGQIVSTSPITISGTASDNNIVGEVKIRLNSGTWQTASGTSSWSNSINLLPNSNLIEVQAFDGQNNPSSIQNISIIYSSGVSPKGIYREGYVSPWADATYGGTATALSTEKVYDGTYSIKMTANAWGAASAQTWNNPQNLTGYSYIRFAVYPNATFTMIIRLYASDGNKVASRLVTANTWNVLLVPLSAFSYNSGTTVNRIDFQNAGTQTIYYIDNIEFT